MATLLILGTPAAARGQISPGPLARPHERLEGALQCVKCHAGGGGRVGGKEEMTAKCVDCHKEIAWLDERKRGLHARVIAQRCASCHPEHAGKEFALVSWPDGGAAERFNHARAGWTLDGAHARTACSDCHKPAFRVSQAARLSQRPPQTAGWVGLETRCAACHEDVHQGKLGSTCSRCHTTTSFTTINRTSFDHDRTRYPLRGRHAAVACEKCHDFSGGQVARNPTFATCTACHTPDPHAGTATLAGRVVDCASCHSVEGWQPSSYTVAQHRLTRYPLEGRHQQARCSGCHVKTPGSAAVVAMRPVTTDCVSCHVDAHDRKYARCVDCHDLGGFRPSKVDVRAHAQYRFPLAGAHRAVVCSACHAEMRRAPVTSTLTAVAAWSGPPLRFTGPAGGCAGCHQSAHGTQFAARPDRGACESCHDVDAFKPARRFDHNRDAAFSLKGAHAAVPCARCHRSARGPDGKPVVIYRPVPTACEACHK